MIVGFVPTSFADKVHGIGTHRFYFSATDMNLVEVTFEADRQHTGKQSNEPALKTHVTVKLPRAYIYNAAGRYTSEREKSLPDKIAVPWLMLIFVHPDGDVHKTFSEQNLYKREVVVQQGVEHKLRLIRKLTMRTTIVFRPNIKNFYEVPPFFQPEDLPIDVRLSFAGVWDGYRVYTQDQGPDYLFGGPRDHFQVARCPMSANGAMLSNWCSYFIRLNELFIAEVEFLDFRFHGGRKFVTERLAAWSVIVCRYFACNLSDTVQMKNADKQQGRDKSE